MQLLYISNACSEAMITKIFANKPFGVFQQAQKYNLLLAEGFAANGQKVTMISSRPINRSIDNRLLIKGEKDCANGVQFHYSSFVNYPGLRQLCIGFSAFWKVLTAKDRSSVVVCDGLNIAASAGAMAAAFLRRFLTVGIVTDVPCFTTSNNDSLTHKLNLWLMRRFGSYLLLTEQMSAIVNSGNKPHIVLEGHADQKMAQTDNTLSAKHPKKVCLYAGALKEIYGVGHLIEGFIAADLADAELHIYGDGDYVPKLQTVTEKNPNVKYMGVAPNSDVVKAELAATLLINPRPTHEEFTKYSFPSKNMEYMASGTPVLTTRLPGMPEDHKPYVYFIEQEDAEGVKTALQTVLAQDRQTLHDFGAAAKKFILQEKTHVSQAAKVLDFIKNKEMEQKSCD